MPKPTKQDAQLLLTLMDVSLSDTVREAYRWLRALPDGLSLDEFERKFPRGSEGWEHLTTIAVYWETAGSLMRRGLVNEDLAFDTFLDAPPWPKLERIIRDRRERDRAPAESENLEWIYARARDWVRKREAVLRKGKAAAGQRRK